VGFVAAEVARQELSVLEIDAFAYPGLFGPQDPEMVRQDIARYRRKLADPRTCSRQLKLRLPGQLGGTAEVDVLMVRDIQNSDDPERVVFFKDWARTDGESCPGSGGFVALSVFHSESAASPRRCILSVTPESGVHLRGLGGRLDQLEAAERTRRYGFDDRVEDPVTREKKTPRWEGASSDPWYDGRAHGYTIVDAPRSGTVLSADEIERAFLQFGRGRESDLPSPDWLAPADRAASTEEQEGALRHLSIVAGHDRRGATAAARCPPPDVFISYPRSIMGWVEQHVFLPLMQWRGQQKVFFDTQSLNPGRGWMSSVAAAVGECGVFLPVYCRAYFERPFCQWELQLALIRDPIGEKQIVVPLMIEAVELPPYCALVQAVNVTAENIERTMLRVLQDLLP
jgi:hypothetical protein